MQPSIVVQAAVCLRSRLAQSPCTACADACPVACIRVGEGGLRVGAGCTGCGRCGAACQMGAILVPGFGLDTERLAAHAAPVLRVACARHAGDAHVRVPCLGGLAEGDLLWLHAQTPAATRLQLEDGGCTGCDSGRGDGHPVAAALQRAIALMAQAGVPAERHPRLVERQAVPAGASDPLQSRGRARRGLFGPLLQPRPAATAAPAVPSWKKPSRARARLLDALRHVAATGRGELPAGLFHAVQVTAACEGHRVCAAVCPTGALVRYRDEAAGRSGIAFDAEHCIACGQCAAACATGALRLEPGQGRAGSGLQTLTASETRECSDCNARFIVGSDAGATRCQRCRRSADLARAAFTSLFPRKPRLQGME